MGIHAHLYYLGLTAVGFDALWGVMVRNGTAQAIGQAKITGLLPSGGPLRRCYTGLPVIDRFLLAPVIFYDGMLHRCHPTQRALLIALFSTMQTTSFTMIVNGFRHSQNLLWPALESMFWGMFNQSHGAAFVYPVYFFTHLEQFTRSPESTDLDHIDEVDAEALVCTSLVAASLPAWLIFPSVVPCSADTRQMLIASYRLTPVILSIAQPLLARFLRVVYGSSGPTDEAAARKRVRRLVKLSLVVSGATATIGHLYGVLTGCLAGGSAVADVFWPGATTVGGPGSKDIITKGCHLFLQNDWWVIVAAVVPCVSSMISHWRGGERGGYSGYLGSQMQRLQKVSGGLDGRWVTLTSLAVLLSPGTVLAWCVAESI